MGSYKVSVKESVQKDLRKIDKRYVPKILAEVEALAGKPRPANSRKLVGSQRSYRLRVGDYRIIYFVDDQAKQIEIQRVGHRGDVYRWIPALTVNISAAQTAEVA